MRKRERQTDRGRKLRKSVSEIVSANPLPIGKRSKLIMLHSEVISILEKWQ